MSPDNEHPIMDSDQQPDGDLGVSSERVGPTGPGQTGTTGVDEGATEDERVADEDAPPEQRPGGEEENPEGIPPKAGYSSKDPRADDEV